MSGRVLRIDDVTREERYFMACLFFEVRENPGPFIELLHRNGILATPKETMVDWGFEVAVFRDFPIDRKEFHSRRHKKITFDAILVTTGTVVVFEAKAQQSFINKQFSRQLEDICAITDLQVFGRKGVKLCAITSSRHSPKPSVTSKIAGIVRWSDLASVYPKSAKQFLRADRIHGEKPDHGRLS